MSNTVPVELLLATERIHFGPENRGSPICAAQLIKARMTPAAAPSRPLPRPLCVALASEEAVSLWTPLRDRLARTYSGHILSAGTWRVCDPSQRPYNALWVSLAGPKMALY
jgi:hypothetical protein